MAWRSSDWFKHQSVPWPQVQALDLVDCCRVRAAAATRGRGAFGKPHSSASNSNWLIPAGCRRSACVVYKLPMFLLTSEITSTGPAQNLL